ncbi:MAG TPA: acyl-CoA carboxylase subunit epsilon [Actinomycetales bacterium]|nr:acyl-CoA carboxylase subunit epsilon [Actinomycetales bacterium]
MTDSTTPAGSGGRAGDLPNGVGGSQDGRAGDLPTDAAAESTSPSGESLQADPENVQAGPESVQIVKGGDVDEDELAALVAGIVAATAAGAPTEPVEPDAAAGDSRWVRGARRRAAFPRHGRDAWRWSLR